MEITTLNDIGYVDTTDKEEPLRMHFFKSNHNDPEEKHLTVYRKADSEVCDAYDVIVLGNDSKKISKFRVRDSYGNFHCDRSSYSPEEFQATLGTIFLKGWINQEVRENVKNETIHEG